MRYLMAMAALSLLFLGACDIIADPHMPSWDVNLTVPLMNERFHVSDIADSVNIIINDDQILTLTGTGAAQTPPFGEVNYTPALVVEGIPLYSGQVVDMSFPIQDPAGSVFLCYGRFAHGAVSYRFQIDNPATTSAVLQLPDIHNSTGSPFEVVSSSNQNWQSYSLGGGSFGIENSSNVFDSLNIHLNITSSQPAGTQVGTLSLDLTSQLGFNKFQGFLYDYVRAVQGTISTISIDYPFELEQAIQLTQAAVQLEVTNEIGFGAEFHGQIRATNSRTGEVRTINVLDDSGEPFAVDSATETGPTVSILNFSDNVSQLLQIMPDEIEIFDAYLLINGGHNGFPGTVQETDILACTYQVDAPLQIILYEHTFQINEPIEIGMVEDTSGQLDRILSAALTLGLTNHIPVGFSAVVYISSQPDIDIANPATYAFSREINVRSSEYTGPDVDENGEQFLNLELTNSELDIFTTAASYMLFTFSFEATDGPVTIYASPADYLQVRGMISANVLVDGGGV